MFQCYFCLEDSVIWDSTFSFDDVGLEGDGIVQYYHCTKCGMFIETRIPFESEDAVGIEDE